MNLSPRVNPRWREAAGLIAGALLLALYSRGGSAWPLGFVMLVPWLWLLGHAGTPTAALLRAAAMSLAFVAVVFGWFGAAIGDYTGIGAGAGVAVLLGLAPLMQPQVLAFAVARHLAGRRHGPLLRALAGASAWVGTEWLVPKLLGDTIGHGLFPSATMRQAADLGGAAGLSFLLILVNEAVLVAILRWRERPRAAWRPLLPAAVLLLAMAVYGQVRLATLSAPAPDAATVKVAMIQASITDYEQLRAEIGAYGVVRRVLDTHYGLSWSALRDHGADVLLWSETVYPTTFAHPRSEDGAALDREIQDFVDTVGVPLVFGTYDLDDAGEYNAAAFLEPGRGLMAFYRKTHPFPLTEHVPRWLDRAWLRRMLPWTGGWQPGHGARVLPLRTRDGREVNVLPLICLDDVRAQLSIDGARLGAQAIVGMSNDSWFTDYPDGARLHLSVAAFRSIETRLPQVRVTTNGLSAVIDDTGEVLASTAMGDQAVLTAELAARDPAPTLMVRWGDWVGRAGVAFLLALAALAAWRWLRVPAVAADTADYRARAALLSPAGRLAAGALRLGAGVGLAWLAWDMGLEGGWQVQSLAQLKLFAFAVVAPALGAWAIQRLGAADVRIEDGRLVLDQRRQRVEVPLASIVGLRPWRLPLPRAGVDLQLAPGQPWARGLVLADAARLQRALAAAGSPARLAGGPDSRLARLATLRAATARPWLDHAGVKFALFPMLPAAVAFRLHQIIAFGSPLGELHTYGLKAWLTGALIWWASWSLGLMLFAAGLWVVIEATTLLVLPLSAARALAIRDAMAWLGRAAFYAGVPAWLAIRLMSG